MILSEVSVVASSVAKLDDSDDDFNYSSCVRKPAGSPMKPLLDVFDDDNDDDDERLARRKSRLLEPHPTSVVSPHTVTSFPVSGQRRADAAAPRGISRAQIGEHYGTCIRLAAENKITSRNAFNLHLIDFMSDMLKNEGHGSFQIASSSLDAGAKIYAGRVDAVHQETYQVLTGLGRPGKQQLMNNNEDGGEDNADGGRLYDIEEEEEEGTGRRGQRKRGQMHRDILQKHLNKIRSKAMAAKVDVDPLFQHQTASYDEGGTAELRMNQLTSLDDTCALILDSSTPVLGTSTITGAATVAASTVEPSLVSGVLWEAISQLLPSRVASSQLVLCPSLQNFRFTDWDPSKDTLESSAWNDLVNQGKTPLVEPKSSVNPDDVPPLVPDDMEEDSAPCGPGGFDDDDGDDGDGDGDGDATLVEHRDADCTEVVGVSSKTAAAVCGQSTAAVTASDTGEKNETEGDLFVMSLKSMLNRQYEYFGQMNDNLLGMWAGPDHWRKKAKRRMPSDDGKGISGDNDGEGEDGNPESATVGISKGRKGVRGRKSKPTKVTFSEACRPSENKIRNGKLSRADWPKNVLSAGQQNTASVNAATVFKEHYRQRVGRQSNQLPTEPTDSRCSFYQLFGREILLDSSQSGWDISKGQTASSELGPSAPHWIDNGSGDGTDPMVVGTTAPTGPGGDTDQRLDDDYDGRVICIGGNDDDDDDDAALPFDGAFTQPVTAAFGEFTRQAGDLELVSQPHQVARIEIGYARTAKMINIRRLKQAMWSYLEDSLSSVPGVLLCPAPARSPVASVASTSSAPVSLPDGGAESGGEAATQLPQPLPVPSSPGSAERCSFGGTLSSLSSRITWQTAKELSISIALNCLLHLCNEKSLFLENSDHFSDIYISQGQLGWELEALKLADDCATDGCATKRPSSSRGDLPDRRAKAKRLRPSTLDSWLDGSDVASPVS